MRILLTNEERLARRRARAKRQQEERKKGKIAIPKQTAGVRGVYRERSITTAMMRTAEIYFFGKRGLETSAENWNSKRCFEMAGGTR